MSTSDEPRHYWPAHLFGPKPAVDARQAPASEPDALEGKGQTVTPFEITADYGRSDFLFEPTFFSDRDIDPKAQTEPAVTPETIRQSLGE